MLQALVVSLTELYRRFGDPNDLDVAIEINQEALDLSPKDHPDRARRVQSIAVLFSYRYQRHGNVHDLEVAQERNEEVVNLIPLGHPYRASALQNLAVSFADRYRKFKEPADLEAVNRHYSESFNCSPSEPEASWRHALQWASIAEEFQTPHGISAYQAAFSLLPELLWIGHVIPVRQHALHRLDIGTTTSNAVRTCINLSDLRTAIELMEQGLATVFQQMLRLKTEVDFLPPDQAKAFRELSTELYGGLPASPLTTVNARDTLVETIRTQPGFERFLLPKSYDVLAGASKGGPVVLLNSHHDRCDAIQILSPTSGPIQAPLSSVTLEQLKVQRHILKELLGRCNVRNRAETESSRLFGKQESFTSRPPQECFKTMLDWLWTHIVSPVHQALRSHGIHGGRLWWLPTGQFGRLPLHACSPTDQFIHSYTATLGSLLDAYHKKPSSAANTVAVVGVAHTGPGGTHALSGVERELKKIGAVVKPTSLRCLQGEQATVDAVKTEIQNCSWIHLACHGKQDLLDPSKSHLMLYGGVLELETILRMPPVNSEFVFLAACQTATGDADLVNESFHLGGGFIAAGFRGAIGTMWSMNDEDGPTVAEIVYSRLFQDGQEADAGGAAEALQLAVRELRNRKVSYQRWVPFIHMGI
ncbi:CHAT domain-containing protein [Mycena vulgaris]|nr:CHAT domain-containing protein [Mycena vulgaris]